VAGTPGLDADLSCAAGRRCDVYPIVTRGHATSRQKEIPSTLAHDLNAEAVAALDEAREMPPGEERTAAIQKAIVFRNAVEILQLLGRKRGASDL
jgi:hypothetical protein